MVFGNDLMFSTITVYLVNRTPQTVRIWGVSYPTKLCEEFLGWMQRNLVDNLLLFQQRARIDYVLIERGVLLWQS